MIIQSLCLLLAGLVMAEEPPAPEYPYPKTRIEKSKVNVEKPVFTDQYGNSYYSTENTQPNKKPVIRGVEKPTRVDADGTFYYGDQQPRQKNPITGTEQPIRKEDGAYFYTPKVNEKSKKKIIGEQPTRQDKDGSFYYEAEPEYSTQQFRFSFGPMSAPKIKPAVANGLEYKDVYSENPAFTFAFEYDWSLTDKSYFKIASGLNITSGRGQFAGDPDLLPREKFQLYVFPNFASLGYRFKASPDPAFVPYLEAGAGYITFIENRSDGNKTSLGGALAASVAGGLQFSLSRYFKNPQLKIEYGIHQIWLDLQYKQIIGLDSRKDFTSSLITLGFAIGF